MELNDRVMIRTGPIGGPQDEGKFDNYGRFLHHTIRHTLSTVQDGIRYAGLIVRYYEEDYYKARMRGYTADEAEVYMYNVALRSGD